MDVLVTQQGETIDQVDKQASDVENDMQRGYVENSPDSYILMLTARCRVQQTEIAVKHARSARRKRWYCFFLTLVILAIVGIVVGVTVSRNVSLRISFTM